MPMKSQPLINTLVIVNLALVVLLFAQTRRGHPDATGSGAPVTRVRALELVDDAGRVRAELKVFPPDPNVKMPDGTTGYPETVLLRLITSKGAPDVKISASEDGGGMVLGGEGGYVQVLSRGTNLPFIKIVSKDGREQTYKP